MINYEPYKNYFNKLGKDKNNIHYVENFIDSKDITTIVNYLNTYKDNDEFMGGKDLREDAVKAENSQVGLLLDKYENKIYNEAYELFTKKYEIPVIRQAVNSTHFVKWIPGMNSKLHCDCEKPDGSPAIAADFYKYNVSVLMYPNDNYIGGEITFPDYGLVIKPKAGSMIMFPGNGAYRHTVERVKEGIRYTMPSWYSFNVENNGKEEEQKSWTYMDSTQLWEGLPDYDKIDPVGINVKGKVFDDKKT